jgi:hypothetical protein
VEANVLKKIFLAAMVAALIPAAAVAQPGAQPYGDPSQGAYYGDRGPYYGDDGRYPRAYADTPYGYGVTPYVRGHLAYDQYGPDPNGLRAPDGHRLKCKVKKGCDDYSGERIKHRECR